MATLRFDNQRDGIGENPYMISNQLYCPPAKGILAIIVSGQSGEILLSLLTSMQARPWTRLGKSYLAR